VVGAVSNDFMGLNTGSTYIYERNLGGIGLWGEKVEITAPDLMAGDQFGRSVAIDGSQIIVGAPYDDTIEANSGSVYFYEKR